MFEAEEIQSAMTDTAAEDSAVVLLFSNKNVLLTSSSDGEKSFPTLREVKVFLNKLPPLMKIGVLDGNICFGAELESEPEGLPDGISFSMTRFVLADLSEQSWDALCRARELVFWRKQHKYCGACRAGLEPSKHDLALVCPNCGMKYYPQIAPAVIVAILRNGGTELLLAHNRNFDSDVYGLIAGFVESGETAEQTVRREILEETGVKVKNIKYLTSQTWPFPNSLMLAFTAEYASGTARADGEELTDLGWFTKENLPKLPQRGSIARRVIEKIMK